MSHIFSFFLGCVPGAAHAAHCQFCNGVHASAPIPSLADFERAIELAFVLSQRDQPAGDRSTASMMVDSLKRRKADAVDVEAQCTCTVCLVEVAIDDELCVLPCEHTFHDGCVKPWLQGHHTCPTCRFPMPTEDADFNREHVAPAARKYEESKRNARARVIEDIRNGKTPEIFKGKCINSAFRGQDCTSACAPPSSTSQNQKNHEASASSTSSSPSAMIRLPCCDHVWHRCCLVHEQEELRKRHVIPSQPRYAYFVCPACRKVSESFTLPTRE